MRKSGLLLHISSLPGAGGIGTLGKEAYAFADFLKKSGMKIWQVLPMGPTGYGESPYQSSSVFAGNPMLISLTTLAEEGLLTFEPGDIYTPSQLEKVEFDAVRANKEVLLHRAFEQSEAKLAAELAAFVKENDWVEDFALFTAVKRSNNNNMWTKWADKDIILRKPEAVAKYRKELDAEVRIALTGTPMENHTGELWSIFDFVLPGYLGTQAAFLRRYGGGEHAEELRERVRPFLMRRLKSEVLADLPKKHEQYLYAAMPPEQEQVYNSLLFSLREHVGQALEDGSLPRARMQVLSVLLKMRQVCCHPKLFLDNYEGTSGKLELLVQTVHNANDAGHRMLIFSQFVGMLQIIKKRLGREGVQCLYLDGDTKPEVRQQLCDRFNGGEGDVFLISLKAGGTGLNLTGADLVIHYDPWWNPAAEDQATDRAHRIGQTRDVTVMKMIAQGTIEEKVTDLSKRKRAIFDRVVIAGETALSSLTEEDIRALFFT